MFQIKLEINFLQKRGRKQATVNRKILQKVL